MRNAITSKGVGVASGATARTGSERDAALAEVASLEPEEPTWTRP